MRHAEGKDKVESWDRQIPFPLVVNGITIGHYVCDFLVYYADGCKDRRREELRIASRVLTRRSSTLLASLILHLFETVR